MRETIKVTQEEVVYDEGDCKMEYNSESDGIISDQPSILSEITMTKEIIGGPSQDMLPENLLDQSEQSLGDNRHSSLKELTNQMISGQLTEEYLNDLSKQTSNVEEKYFKYVNQLSQAGVPKLQVKPFTPNVVPCPLPKLVEGVKDNKTI